jgi:hypothetical protein
MRDCGTNKRKSGIALVSKQSTTNYPEKAVRLSRLSLEAQREAVLQRAQRVAGDLIRPIRGCVDIRDRPSDVGRGVCKPFAVGGNQIRKEGTS